MTTAPSTGRITGTAAARPCTVGAALGALPLLGHSLQAWRHLVPRLRTVTGRGAVGAA